VIHRADIVAGLSEPSVERQTMMNLLEGQSHDPSAALGILDVLVTQQARTMAQQDVYTIGAGILIVMVFMVGMLPRRLPTTAAEGNTAYD